MQSIQIAQLKSHFSDVLKTIKNDGEKYIVEYGKKHEKVAMIIPYDKREFGICKNRGSFTLKKDFKLSDEEFLGL